MLHRHRLGSLQDLAGMRVGTAHFMFLVVRESEDAQRKNLVNFGAIEKVPGALGSNLRVVVQNDG